MLKLNRNDRVLVTCLAIFVGMIGLTYASVPFYRYFCAATGFDGTPLRADRISSTMSSETIEIRFDANIGQNLKWDFRPSRPSMKLHLGENGTTTFYARNLSGQDMEGRAVFNVSPGLAGKYFNKTQCFCFDRQKLKAGEAADLGVAFFVDPAIAKDPETRTIRSIVLSYTFFPAKGDEAVAELKTP